MHVFDQEVLLGLLGVAILVCLVLYERKHGIQKTEKARRVNRALDLWMSVGQGERVCSACAEEGDSYGTRDRVWGPR